MDDIIGQIVQDGVVERVEQLKISLNEAFLAFEKFNTEASKPDRGNSTKTRAQSMTELEKVTKSAVTTQNKLTAAQSEAFVVAEKRKLQLSETRSLLREEIKLQGSQRNSIKRAELLIRKYTREKQNLNKATKEGIRLNESYNKAIAKANAFTKKYGDEVSNQRKNVGNYASANIELTQVLREMPAFANSAQTGLMAISNNLPQLLERIRLIHKDMGSLGGTLRTLGKQMLSFNALMAIGVTALTVFGPKIIKAIQQLDIFKKSVSEAEESQKLLNEAWKDDSVKTAIKNVEDLKSQIDLARKKLVDKEQVVRHYNETIGKTAGLVSNLDSVESKLVEHGDAYIKMTLKKAAANLSLEKAASKTVEAEQVRNSNEVGVIDRVVGSSNYLKFGQKLKFIKEAIIAGSSGFSHFTTETNLALGKAYQEQLNSNAKGLEKEADNYISIYKKLLKEAADISSKNNFDLFGENEASGKSKKGKSKKDKPFQLINPGDIFGGNDGEDLLREQERRLDLLSKGLIEWAEKTKPIFDEELQKLFSNDNLSDEEAISLRAKIQIELANKAKAKEEFLEFVKELEQINKVAQQVLGDIGDFSQIIAERELQRIGAQKEAIKNKYDLEAELIKANYDTIEQRDRDLAKLAIDRQVQEERLRQQALRAKQRAARFEKAANIASIISTTALAVISALAPPPVGLGPVAGIPLAFTTGITGATQLAKAIATPIPQYAEGTDSHKGGYAVVGDGGKKEVVQTPDGNAYLTPDKSTLVDLPKYTKVYPDVDRYLYQNPKNKRYNSTTTNNSFVDFSELRSDVKELNRTMKRKNLSVNVYGDASLSAYKRSKIV